MAPAACRVREGACTVRMFRRSLGRLCCRLKVKTGLSRACFCCCTDAANFAAGRSTALVPRPICNPKHIKQSLCSLRRKSLRPSTVQYRCLLCLAILSGTFMKASCSEPILRAST
ncbi:hypothetical protein ISCGN_016590 [Ixodes scapularis]